MSIPPWTLRNTHIQSGATFGGHAKGIWNCLKNVELKNLCCSDLKELRQKILQAVKRLRQKTHIIKTCFQQAGLKL